jgi:hypothetical protein
MVSFSTGIEDVKPVEEDVRNHAAKPKDDVPPSGGEAVETGEKGVIRLLLAGHFQGVADDRLRMNFADELRLPPTQNAQTAFADGISGLVDGLRGKVGELFSSTSDIPESLETETADPNNVLTGALAEFAAEADKILASVKDGSRNLNNALEDLREAFSGLAATLGSTFGGAPSPAVEDTDDGSTTVTAGLETIPNEGDAIGAPAPSETAATALQSLKEWFDEEVGKLEAAMTEAQVLSSLSEPRGNGVAFSKFLEIYKSLTWGFQPEAGTQDQAAGIDVLA